MPRLPTLPLCNAFPLPLRACRKNNSGRGFQIRNWVPRRSHREACLCIYCLLPNGHRNPQALERNDGGSCLRTPDHAHSSLSIFSLVSAAPKGSHSAHLVNSQQALWVRCFLEWRSLEDGAWRHWSMACSVCDKHHLSSGQSLLFL